MNHISGTTPTDSPAAEQENDHPAHGDHPAQPGAATHAAAATHAGLATHAGPATRADHPSQAAGAEGPAVDPSGFGARGRARRRVRFLRKARELGYRDLGGLVFNLHRFGQRNDDLVIGKLGMLERIDAELRAVERALGERQPVTVLREAGITACPRCAAIHGSEDRFCPNCGLALGRHADLPIDLRSVTGAPGSPATAPSAPQPHAPAAQAGAPAPAQAGSAPQPSSPAQAATAQEPVQQPAATTPAARTPVGARPPQPSPQKDQPTEIIRPSSTGE